MSKLSQEIDALEVKIKAGVTDVGAHLVSLFRSIEARIHATFGEEKEQSDAAKSAEKGFRSGNRPE